MDRLSAQLRTLEHERRRALRLGGAAPFTLLACVLACTPVRERRERATVSLSVPSGPAPAACSVGPAPAACGDPCGDGVVVDADITRNTTWDCPVYTLPAPVFVQGTGSEPAQLFIAPGTRIRGLAGDLAQGRLPGSLIVTRRGRIEARGTRDAPIVFTSARPVGARAPGDWGGVVLLGSAPINVPADYLDSGNRAGEMFVEGLPPAENTTYGASDEPAPAADAGSGAADAGGDADAFAAPARVVPNPEHDCGTLRFVRIEFAGFEVGDTNELNGLTVAGCGRGTLLDYVQVHLGSDDGIELFGGNADLRHTVITGAQDDALDWDQGWSGRVQFLAIRQHGIDAGGDTDNGFEGDGFADPERPAGAASSPVLFNVTLLSDSRSARALRLREGTRLELHDAIIAAPGGGPLEGLVEIGDATTADQLTAGHIRIDHSILQGVWPTLAQPDSGGRALLLEAYLGSGAGSDGNTIVSGQQLIALLPAALADGGWVPSRGAEASHDFLPPSDADPTQPFFDPSAAYRGAFDPSGTDWSLGWTDYPLR